MDNQRINIAAVGDIMPGGVLSGINSGYISPKLSGFLASADIRVGTLETAIGDTPTFNPEKMSRSKDVIYAKVCDLGKVRDLGFDVVSLANNHFFDLGDDAALRTLTLLDEYGIAHIGAGKNLDEAAKPWVVRCKGKSVAFLAFCSMENAHVGWCPYATADTPGVNPMHESHVVEEIRKYKALHDYVVVVPHWGREYHTFPTKSVYQMAMLMQNAGADLILGGHTHCIQPVTVRKHGAIVYGMGNFLFPDRLVAPPRVCYYPESPLCIDSLPSIDRFTYVDTISLKRWNNIARYGSLIEVSIGDGGITAHRHVTYLNMDNYLDVREGSFPRRVRIRLAQLSLQSGLYPTLYIPMQVMLFFKPKIKMLLRRLK